MPAPKTGIHGPLLLEEPLIRTPYELLRRSHRSAQRQVERDFVAVQTQLSSLLKSFTGDPDKDKDPALSKLDVLSDRMRGLKRKLDDLQPSPGAPSALRDRITYVDESLLTKDKDAVITEPSTETDEPMEGVSNGVEKTEKRITRAAELPSKFAPEDHTLDRYVIDHLLRTGRVKTARALAAAQGIDSLVDIKLFTELAKIEAALTNKHSCTEALAWCGENRGTLKKQGSDLEFVLRLQEFIELCRKRDTVAAITYARKHMAPWASTHMNEVQQGMTLLAFGETTGVPLYRKLYDRTRWETVRDRFRETFLTIYALPSQSLLALSLSAGLSSLRLPACAGGLPISPKTEDRPFSSSAQNLPPEPLLPPVPDLHFTLDSFDFTERDPALVLPAKGESPAPAPTTEPPRANVDCPTCGTDLRVLAREVPMAHHVNSTIVCRISGAVMDSNNEPMAFPNGHVYSSKALQEMAKNNYNVVTCPITNETCSFSKLRKVYIS